MIRCSELGSVGAAGGTRVDQRSDVQRPLLEIIIYRIGEAEIEGPCIARIVVHDDIVGIAGREPKIAEAKIGFRPLVVLTGERIQAGVIDGEEGVLHGLARAADLHLSIDKARRSSREFEPDIIIGPVAPAGGFSLIRCSRQRSIVTRARTHIIDKRCNIHGIGEVIISRLRMRLHAWHE